jgi:glucosamine--fructose-6-phosphate aminotransferase (isomerizing)
MCGIIGYTGHREATPILLEGLRRLEYRGYDSAGLATLSGNTLHVRKKAGRLSELIRLVAEKPVSGKHGISHTRWATHGAATDYNAHPHIGGNNLVAVVHNGVIENYAHLKTQLESEGFVFRSQTDTEVIAHLIAYYYEGDLLEAVRKALPRLKGTYGLAVISPRHPGLLIGARFGSPLVVGLGEQEMFLASDPSALVGYTQRAVYLNDGQICVLTPERWEIFDRDSTPVEASIHALDWQPEDVELNGFDHYMLKEIYEQPEALENAMRGRLDETDATAHFGGLNLSPRRLRQVDRIILTGCGTSYHAGLVGEYLFEELSRIPVEVEYASEFRYRNAPIEQNTILIAITQSGETADTLAAVREAKRKGIPTLSICNVVGSTIAREADGGVYLRAGPEIGVASTKAFTSQVLVLPSWPFTLDACATCRQHREPVLSRSYVVCRTWRDRRWLVMRSSQHCGEVLSGPQLPLSGSAVSLSGGPRGRLEDERNQLHSRRRLSRRRDEARTNCPGGRKHAFGFPGAAWFGVRQSHQQHGRNSCSWRSNSGDNHARL